MGMAASQARFLGLTARKSNLEYEGQQINQQRTALSNQSANYYNQMLGMQVPVPPSIDDYTKTVYSFNDGALENTITSMIAQGNGNYKVSYLSKWQDDFAIVAAGCTSIANVQSSTGTNSYYVGKDELKPLSEGFVIAKRAINAAGDKFRLSDSMIYNAGGRTVQIVAADYDKICSIIGAEPQMSDYDVAGLVINYRNTQCYSGVYSEPQYETGHIEHNLCKLVWSDSQRSVTSSTGVTLTNNARGYYSLTQHYGGTWTSVAPDSNTTNFKNRLQSLYPDLYQQIVDLYIDLALYLSDHVYNNRGFDIADYTLSNTSYDHSAVTQAAIFTRWEQLWKDIEALDPTNLYINAHREWEEAYRPYEGTYMNAADYTDIYTLDEALFYDGSDPYLSSLSPEELEKLYEGERYYATQLSEIYGEPKNGWYVRYRQDSTTGEYYPVFYNGDDLADGTKIQNGDIYSSVKTYKVGSCTRQEEIKQRTAKLEQDSSGRFINLTLYDANNNPTTYALTTNTVTDNSAYDDAINQYEYDKYQYDQRINEINAKIEIVQSEDKNLELRLKQLDTEQDAISTEMDAVSKVIEKNVESTFRIFG